VEVGAADPRVSHIEADFTLTRRHYFAVADKEGLVADVSGASRCSHLATG
jgi:hypothetical protein